MHCPVLSRDPGHLPTPSRPAFTTVSGAAVGCVCACVLSVSFLPALLNPGWWWSGTEPRAVEPQAAECLDRPRCYATTPRTGQSRAEPVYRLPARSCIHLRDDFYAHTCSEGFCCGAKREWLCFTQLLERDRPHATQLWPTRQFWTGAGT